MAKLNETQSRLLNSIESEMDLIIQLRRKYDLGFKIYTRIRELLTQQEAILNQRYSLERKNLGNNKVMIIAHLEDGSIVTCRYIESSDAKIAE